MRSDLKFIFLLFILIFLACDGQKKEEPNTLPPLKKDTSIKYARRFAIAYGEGLTLVYLFGNRADFDTTAIYIIYKDTHNLKRLPENSHLIKSPCKKIAALSSIYASMLCELGMAENIAAIDNIDYVNNPAIIAKFKKKDLKELARTPDIDVEQTIALSPDIIFTFGMGDGEKTGDKKLTLSGIPVAVTVDHLEESPLARAEWIKFFAAFVDKKQIADSIFKAVEKNYFELKAIAQKTEKRPTVFTETKFGDTWYMPGGKSYVAQLLNDAGADYLWKDDKKAGSLPLSFEQVFAKAREADFWINLSAIKSKKEILSYESRYSEFRAYKTGNLYNNTKVKNSRGYSIYWETGMIYPDRILSDLIQIFHPEFGVQIKNDFYYYEQIK